jgi:hypothetical protein
MAEEIISLGEVAQLTVGNWRRTDLAAARCREQRVAILQRYRGRAGDPELVLFIRLEELPRLLGGNHRLVRDPRGWRIALAEWRRHETRALKARAERESREARLRRHVDAVAREVRSELAKTQTSRWRQPRHTR